MADELVDDILKWSSYVEVTVNTGLGKSTLDQMLCHRICTYGKYYDINRRLFPETVEELFQKCKDSDKMVQVALKAFYKKPARYSFDSATIEEFDILVWAPTIKEALVMAYTFYEVHDTGNSSQRRRARSKDKSYLLVEIPGVNEDGWSNKGS